MAVQALQATLRDAEAMGDLGHEPGAVARLAQLAPKIEATGYKPLLAQMLELQGRFQTDTDGAGASEVSLRRAFAAAVGGGDDITAAKAATHLAFSVGYLLGREAEGISWVRIADASLDRSGPGNQRIRGWVRQSEGSILGRTRRFSEASAQFEQAVALKEQALGPSHPDVAISLIALANMLKELGELPRALAVAERALAILAGQGQPYAYALNIDGEVLQSLGRRAEARAAFERSLQTEQAEFVLGDPLTGLGRVKLDSGDAAGAIPLLERGLRIRDREWTDPTIVAESRFALAQALWASGSDHSRALSLATAARRAYADARAPRELGEVETWLATHAPKRRQP